MAEGFRLGLEVIAFVEEFSSVAHGTDKTSVLIAFPQHVEETGRIVAHFMTQFPESDEFAGARPGKSV